MAASASLRRRLRSWNMCARLRERQKPVAADVRRRIDHGWPPPPPYVSGYETGLSARSLSVLLPGFFQLRAFIQEAAFYGAVFAVADGERLRVASQAGA